MKTLIFGSRGQLGKDLMIVFAEAGNAIGLDLPVMDIADPRAADAAVASFAPDLIVNAAAYTDVEAAEDHRDDAYRVNETGAGAVAEAANRTGIPLVFISTDFVFDGKKTDPYRPDDPTNPLSVYGASKLAGEVATRAAAEKSFIVRTAWLYGPGGNNFPKKILALAGERDSLVVVEEEIGSPTHTWDLALVVRAIANTTAYGTYHAVNSGQCSRYEFAKAILEGARVKVPVEPCSADRFPTKAARPMYSVLDCAALTDATGQIMRPWQDALAHYLQRHG